MTTISDAPEIRDFPALETGVKRAQMRFDEAVGIARHLAEAERLWVRLGHLLTVMERDGDLERLGFKSIGSCIKEIEVLTGYHRASIYAFKQLYSECSANGAEVPDMPLGSGHTFKKLSSGLQRDPEIIEAVKTKKPKEFKAKIAAEHPECHIEETEEIRFHFEGTFVPIWREFLESVRLLEETPDLPYESAVEIAVLAWLNEFWGEPEAGITNLARARQIRGL